MMRVFAWQRHTDSSMRTKLERQVEEATAWTFEFGPLAAACERGRNADPEKGSPIVFAEDCYR